MNGRPAACALALLCLPAIARADAGVLIPWSVSHDPDPSVLSLKRMDVRVRIDHLHVRVDLKSIFENHTDRAIEGRYVLPLGERAAVEAFSVWQGEERLTGVIVEKRKGRQLFEQLTRQNLDPGLAESDDDRDKSRDFTIRVAPIPPRGTARVEVSFAEDLAISSGGAQFTLPWKPRRFGVQRVAELHVDLAVDGAFPLASVKLSPEKSSLRWTTPPAPGAARFAGRLDAVNAELGDDLTIEMALAPNASAVAGETLAYRDFVDGGRQDLSPFGDGTTYRDPRGYFLVRALFGIGAPTATARPRAPRDVVILLDTSLSMQWEKLERSFEALSHFLGRLDPGDRFDVLTFNDQTRAFRPALAPASSSAVQAALQFVRESFLGGGTDLGAALAAGLALLAQSPAEGRERYEILISDGNPTLGEIGYRKLGERYAAANQPRGQARPTARLFVLGVGDDAATALLDRLAGAGDGHFTWAREGGSAAFQLRTFFDKLGQASLREIVLTVDKLAGIEQVYPPARATVFAGSDATFFGRYRAAGAGTATVKGRGAGPAIVLPLALPAQDPTRPWVARGWARYRIDDLLDQIAVDGEEPAWVSEVIALAKEFHFVTPYTSFIAAPRSQLRPRVIQPGDPVLRVKAPADVVRVAAVLPFGLEKALRYLPSEDVWETRFLAPTWMKDGTYHCTLVLTDADGHKSREDKSFVIDSKPPEISATLGRRSARPGERVPLEARADADTRRITARLGGGPAGEVSWDADRKRSIGAVQVPADQPTGSYLVTVTAEDMAHNMSSTQLALDVVAP